jgi:predicted MFS family arabinose efflux permease
MNRRGTLLTLALAVGAFSTALNGTLLGPLLKDIARAFAVGDVAVGQLGTLHALVAATVAVLAAPLLDRYGRRAVLRGECAILLAGTRPARSPPPSPGSSPGAPSPGSAGRSSSAPA